MRKLWLNSILHLSSYLYKLKSEIIGAGYIMSLFLAIYILFLEVILFIISLPTYVLFSTKSLDRIQGYDKERHRYKLGRKLTIAVIATVIVVILAKIILLFLITIFSGAPTVS